MLNANYNEKFLISYQFRLNKEFLSINIQGKSSFFYELNVLSMCLRILNSIVICLSKYG